MAKNFKWVRIPKKYGVKNWTTYELFVEGKPNRIALIDKIDTVSNYTAIVDFDSKGYNGVYYGWNVKKGTLTTFAYLDDCKRAVEKHYGLRRN